MNPLGPGSPRQGGATGLAADIRAELVRRGSTVSVAESCTGGLIGKLLTDEPGSSAYFRGGVIAYADDVKQAVLDVSARTLAAHGAVSEPVAQEMAAGVRRLMGSDVGLSVTGIAGPTGATPSKPVGTVCFAAAYSDGARVETRLFPGSRGEIRESSALAVLALLGEILEEG